MIDKPLSFEEWRGNKAPVWDGIMGDAVKRLHEIDHKKQFDNMIKAEYQEYLSNFNGNWLL